MRIAFVTGSLEPGRDGVGDYTRRLAAECVRAGHEVALLAVAEPSPVNSMVAEPLPTLRLTAAEWRGDGGARAGAWIEAFRADWACLQFVPYSFDPRGLFGGSIDALRTTLGGAKKRQIFFHEVWIGSYQGAPWRERFVGWCQRRATRALLRAVAPDCVHTSIAYNRAALATIGQKAKILPLFGNVPLIAKPESSAALLGVDPAALVCGIFGSIDPQWEAAAFLSEFARLAAGQGRPAALVAVGGLGPGAARFEEIAVEWRERIACVALGRREAVDLSAVFARFDFAATSVPWNIVGKSGSVAALREHGLRVVVTASGRPPRFAGKLADDAESDAGLIPYFRTRALTVEVLLKTPSGARPPLVAQQFLADLHAAR